MTRLARTLALLLAVAAIAPMAASAATTHKKPLRSSLEIPELNIYDAHLSQKCGFDVVATLSGEQERTIWTGRRPTDPAHEIARFDGRIEWLNEANGKTYADGMRNTLHIRYPQGIELFKPAKVTVTGSHGGTFPIGGGPAGTGVLVYDATIYAIDDEGFTYWSVDGDPKLTVGNFKGTAKRICAALR
jgi:hypothetical protein